MKTYTTPVLTDITLGEVEIDGDKHTVVGVVPFIAAALSAAASVVSAVASVAASVTQAKQTYKDVYMDSQIIDSLDGIE